MELLNFLGPPHPLNCISHYLLTYKYIKKIISSLAKNSLATPLNSYQGEKSKLTILGKGRWQNCVLMNLWIYENLPQTNMIPHYTLQVIFCITFAITECLIMVWALWILDDLYSEAYGISQVYVGKRYYIRSYIFTIPI